jgi:hypothetical protein
MNRFAPNHNDSRHLSDVRRLFEIFCRVREFGANIDRMILKSAIKTWRKRFTRAVLLRSFKDLRSRQPDSSYVRIPRPTGEYCITPTQNLGDGRLRAIAAFAPIQHQARLQQSDPVSFQRGEPVDSQIPRKQKIVDDEFGVIDRQGEIVDDEFGVIDRQGEIVDDEFGMIDRQQEQTDRVSGDVALSRNCSQVKESERAIGLRLALARFHQMQRESAPSEDDDGTDSSAADLDMLFRGLSDDDDFSHVG